MWVQEAQRRSKIRLYVCDLGTQWLWSRWCRRMISWDKQGFCALSVHTAIRGARPSVCSVFLCLDSKGSSFLRASFLGSLHSCETRISKGTQVLSSFPRKILPQMTPNVLVFSEQLYKFFWKLVQGICVYSGPSIWRQSQGGWILRVLKAK